MSDLFETITAIFGKYYEGSVDTPDQILPGSTAATKRLTEALQGPLLKLYELVGELDERDIGYTKEQAALGIVRQVNAKIRGLLLQLAAGTATSKNLSFVITDPRHVRASCVANEPLWQLLIGQRDIGEIRSLIDELTLRFVVSGEIPPLLVDCHGNHGDIKISFQFPY